MNLKRYIMDAVVVTVTALVLLLAYTAYQDHQVLWQVVSALNASAAKAQQVQPTPQAK